MYPSTTTLPFISSLTPARVAVPLAARSKDAVLTELVALAAPDSPMQAAILREVLARETTFPTALDDGVALPHLRTPFVRNVQLSAAVLDEPIVFGQADGNAVDVLFLLLSPSDAPSEHLQALRAISRVLGRPGLIGRLRATTSAAEFVREVRSAHRR